MDDAGDGDGGRGGGGWAFGDGSKLTKRISLFLSFSLFLLCGIRNSRNFFGGRGGVMGGRPFCFFCKFKLETDSCFPLLF